MTRSEWIARVRARLEELDAQFDELQAKARRAGGRLRRGLHERAAALGAQRECARDKLAEVQRAGESAWDAVREGARDVGRDIDRTVAEARRAFLEGLGRD